MIGIGLASNVKLIDKRSAMETELYTSIAHLLSTTEHEAQSRYFQILFLSIS